MRFRDFHGRFQNLYYLNTFKFNLSWKCGIYPSTHFFQFYPSTSSNWIHGSCWQLFGSVVIFYAHCRIMSLPASDRVYSLQVSESWTLFHFWFGFIREAFNSLVCVAFSLCFTHLLITIAVTVGFWCLFCIYYAICDFNEAHSLVSFDTDSASCTACNFQILRSKWLKSVRY